MPESAPLQSPNPLAACSRAQLFDRALGAYLGLAIGDALGATVEFMTPREIRHQYGVHRDMIGGGWLRLKPGQVTDDTTMSLALGDALLQGQQQGRPFDTGLMAEAFVRWWRGKPVDCGNTCRRGIMRYLADGSLQGPPQPGDGGNGALMRNLPVALATLGRPECLAPVSIAQAHITHHHPLSDAATVAFGQMLHALLRAPAPPQALAACRAIADDLVGHFPKFRYQPYPGRATGYVVDTVQTVLHHFLATPDFEAAVVGTVNEGEDADTTGALAGMLAGALCGAQALPQRWLGRLERSTRMAITEQTSALLALALGA
ncbi:ADP-ribosyl-[dinitrogen reductase] hydrolase [Extensimonas sp. H3M7-6]|uniref:ADP-ribosyl-[dinitrogen reductase] hydrolase n=1 Tax=Extensimonas soli TaxID=3031322 RepID=UPI0023DB4DDF|nr:ADP-ribosyl-[dinitrogen reductase] hydrolase [Extensimonas sp. H3M7-6]MDF1482532.1 ADP-ribosyl-[dinitrogen reductase] hydrolase [Extensimonas sp. H3M7-6]